MEPVTRDKVLPNAALHTVIGFGYVMNLLGFRLISDPRKLALRRTLFCDVLGARPQT